MPVRGAAFRSPVPEWYYSQMRGNGHYEPAATEVSLL